MVFFCLKVLNSLQKTEVSSHKFVQQDPIQGLILSACLFQRHALICPKYKILCTDAIIQCWTDVQVTESDLPFTTFCCPFLRA